MISHMREEKAELEQIIHNQKQHISSQSMPTLPEQLPWITKSKLTLNWSSEATGFWEIDKRDQSGPKFVLDSLPKVTLNSEIWDDYAGMPKKQLIITIYCSEQTLEVLKQ